MNIQPEAVTHTVVTGQVRRGQVRSGQVRSGLTCLGYSLVPNTGTSEGSLTS
jgi:hypothetical protein